MSRKKSHDRFISLDRSGTIATKRSRAMLRPMTDSGDKEEEEEQYFPVDVSRPGVQALLLTIIKLEKRWMAWEEQQHQEAS